MARKCNISIPLLRMWWEDFNDIYFYGVLNVPDRFEITESKRVLGQFHGTGRIVQFNTIRISKYYDRTEREFQETLIHEMIHQWQYESGMEVCHKASFKKKAAEINKKGGWDIARTTSVGDASVADGVKSRERNVSTYLVKFTRNGNTPAFAFATKNLWNSITSNPKRTEFVKNHPYYGHDMEVYYFEKQPASCKCFLVNRVKLKNYDYNLYEDTINSALKTAKKVEF